MSESDEEDYAFYGTPLEPIDEDNIPKKKAFSLEDQIVTDSHGRRRFHGAFTGGFSAGFYNTVGSLEGWKPTPFKSSRNNKATICTQRPEDFMDDEDVGEFGIAPKVLRAKPEYGGSKGKKREMQRYSGGPIPGEPVLKSILEPVIDTVGIKLLMRMGWRAGQGVGPRMTRAEKKRVEKKEGHDIEDNDSDVEDFIDPSILYAPTKSRFQLIVPKTDIFGLGYKGLDKAPILSGHVNLFEPEFKLQEKTKSISIRGQAFGVGAFEEDDEDIYSKDNMSRYDFALEPIGSKKSTSNNAKLLAITPQAHLDSIEGFLAGVGEGKVFCQRFSAPELPSGWCPQHKGSKFSVGPSSESLANLTPGDRAVIIGEQSGGTTALEESNKLIENVKIKPGSFRPFESDPDKQRRYEKYLAFVKIGAKDAFCRVQPSTMTEWEKERERNEFESAAALYTPLSGFMAERFTSAKQDPDSESSLNTGTKVELIEAARAKMFGPLTRSVTDWLPCSLIYKRFNVAQPKGSGGDLAIEADKANKKQRMKFSVFDFLEASKNKSMSDLVEEADLDNETENIKLEPELHHGEVPRQEEIEFKEPADKKDLFKAIFLSSSSEDEGNDEDTKEKSLEVMKENILRNTSPPRGIFANLDLDALKATALPHAPQVNPKEKEIKEEKETKNEDDLYGPRLPSTFVVQKKPEKDIKKLPVLAISVHSSSDSSEDEWVEKPSASEKSNSKKHRKKSQKKKKKETHKHKKKKHK